MYRICLRRYSGQGRLIKETPCASRGSKKTALSQRNLSSGQTTTKSPWVKYTLGGFVGVSAGLGGTIAYAGYSKEFRELLSSKHEYINDLLDAVYGSRSVEEKGSGKVKKYSDEVVVVTTMDHQPGVSAVDLDISNMDERKKSLQKDSDDDSGTGGGDDTGGGTAEVIPPTLESGEPAKPAETATEIPVDTEIQESTPGTPSAPEVADDAVESTPEPVTETTAEAVVVPAEEEAPADVAVVQDAETTAAVASDPVEAVTEAVEAVAIPAESPPEDVVQAAEPPVEAEKVVVAQVSVSEPDPIAQAEAELAASETEKKTIETLLQVQMDKLLTEGQEVMNAQKRAAGTIYTYVSQLGNSLAVPSDDPAIYETWKRTSDLEKESQEAIDGAKAQEVTLQQKIAAVRGMISALRKFGESDVADKAQALSSSISLKVQRTAEDIKKASNDLVSMVEYHTLAATAKREFREGLGQLSEEAPAEETESKTARDGTSALLIYALKKVDFLTNALEKRAKEEEERVIVALEKQRQEEEKRFNGILEEEIKRVQEEDHMEQQKKEIELISNYEAELRKQLKRQASAHREHLADVLNLQAAELDEAHKQTLASRLNEQHRVYEDELEKKVATLKGVGEAVNVVVDAEEENRKARELWLAVQSLFTASQEPLINGKSRSLLPEIVALENSADDDLVIKQVVSTIPAAAAVGGVVTEAELSRRFRKVKSVSRKVAMVGADSDSLLTFLLSYLRSLVVFDTSRCKEIEAEIDPEEIDTYEILGKADMCIKAGDIEQAVKFMNLLRGVSRKVAQDWLNDAKIHLETKLALDFLLAFARSKGVGTAS